MSCLALLTALDRPSNAVATCAPQEKGPAAYPIQVVVQSIKFWGHSKVILGGDQEPAITALRDAIALARPENTTFKVGPRMDSKPKGPIESAGRRAQPPPPAEH